VLRRVAAAAPLLLCVTACGGGGSPSGPSGPVPGFDLVAVVFYDENGNGTVDPGELVHVPDVELLVGARSARSDSSGRTVITGVPAGHPTVGVRAQTLPPFFTVPAGGVPATVPQPAGVDVMVPLALPIGTNRPNTYMGFGDSITEGEGSSNGTGYRDRLQSKLVQHLGRATVLNQGIFGTRSNAGALRIDQSLQATRPAYTLIIYGTNDWNQSECKTNFPCFTIDSLRQMVRAARFFNSLPLLATIPPCNVGFDDRATPERQDWIARMDDLIRTAAREEGAVLVDIHAALMRQPSLSALFVDHIHPNDSGYEIIATEFFNAITRPAVTGVAAEPPAVLASLSAARPARAPAPRRITPGPKRDLVPGE
jgi:lysophospholipase L1-like esterase